MPGGVERQSWAAALSVSQCLLLSAPPQKHLSSCQRDRDLRSCALSWEINLLKIIIPSQFWAGVQCEETYLFTTETAVPNFRGEKVFSALKRLWRRPQNLNFVKWLSKRKTRWSWFLEPKLFSYNLLCQQFGKKNKIGKSTLGSVKSQFKLHSNMEWDNSHKKFKDWYEHILWYFPPHIPKSWTPLQLTYRVLRK